MNSIVSAIALIVALSVAGYVYVRRKREMARQKEEEELYKFQENSRNSYMEAPLPQYTGMIQSSLPSLPQLTYVYALFLFVFLDARIVPWFGCEQQLTTVSLLSSFVLNSNLRVMNPDSDDDENNGQTRFNKKQSFEVNRGTSPGWRRGSFDDD
jgi:hypothetical protein